MSNDVDTPRLWVERLSLTNFRNYQTLEIVVGPGPVVLYGANGSGKTNMLEAVSLLAPGRGMRRAAFSDLAIQNGAPQGDETAGLSATASYSHDGTGDGAATCVGTLSGTGLSGAGVAAGAGAATGQWAVAARVQVEGDAVDIGTGMQPGIENGRRGERSGRVVRINGATKSGSGALGFMHMVWLTPASDGLFTGGGGDRRRFLDRLTQAFDPSHGVRAGQFERAMRQRNRLLSDGGGDPALLDGLELIMAETGVAVAAARVEVVTALQAEMGLRRARAQNATFPWAEMKLEGGLENAVATMPAVDAEDAYREQLARGRERDRVAGRTLNGPHRADLVVWHGPKQMLAKVSSTGEQKALLVGLVLAHSEVLARRTSGSAPILLLDEIAAHLDVHRREALYDDLIRLKAQAWLTGTDKTAFEGLKGRAFFCQISAGNVGEITQE